MSLKKQLSRDLLQSMKSGDHKTRRVLSVFVGDIQSDEKRGFVLEDKDIINRLQKSFQNSKENYRINGGLEWKDDYEVLESYLPQKMSRKELEEVVDREIRGLDNPNIGSVMKALKEKYQGTFDGKEASYIVKARLS